MQCYRLSVKTTLLMACLGGWFACAAPGAREDALDDESSEEAPVAAPADAGAEPQDEQDVMRGKDAAALDGRVDASSTADAELAPGDARAVEASTSDSQAANDAAIVGDASKDGSASSEGDPCEPGEPMLSGQTAGGRGNGFVEMQVQPPNEYTRLRTKMTVGEEPPKVGTVFEWPGFQPLRASDNFNPIGNGVLQPVLGWGPACSPGGLRDYSSWWISAMYVNVTTQEPGYRGCYGSKLLRVDPGDVLEIDIALRGTKWVQSVRNSRNGERIEYTIDLKGQQQNRALFWIELPNGTAKPVDDSVFDDVVLSTKMPAPLACNAIARGGRDFVAKPRFSKDGLHCCIDRLTLRASGVNASTSPLTAAFLGLPASAVTESTEEAAP